MNNQEIFDKVVAHARLQNCKAAYSDNRCKYRTDNGLKCFIGALISDELYDSRCEGYIPDRYDNHPSQLRFNKILNDCGIEDEQFFFVRKLQIIHDSRAVNQWENEFEVLANEQNLNYTKPEQEEVSQ